MFQLDGGGASSAYNALVCTLVIIYYYQCLAIYFIVLVATFDYDGAG